MNAVLIALLAVPTATGLLGLVLGRRVAGPLAVLGTLAALVFAVILALEVDPSSRSSAPTCARPTGPARRSCAASSPSPPDAP